nr:MAG TPA: zinc-ribbon domain protein [Caudoviricetes sp.]
MSRKIKIKCKTCGNTLGTFEFNGYITFDYKCKKCKQRNTGVIREHKKKGEKDG